MKRRRGVYVQQCFPRDLPDRCGVLSPGNRRWFHGDRKFRPWMGWNRVRFIVNFKASSTFSFPFSDAKKSMKFNPLTL